MPTTNNVVCHSREPAAETWGLCCILRSGRMQYGAPVREGMFILFSLVLRPSATACFVEVPILLHQLVKRRLPMHGLIQCLPRLPLFKPLGKTAKLVRCTAAGSVIGYALTSQILTDFYCPRSVDVRRAHCITSASLGTGSARSHDAYQLLTNYPLNAKTMSKTVEAQHPRGLQTPRPALFRCQGSP